MADNPNGGNAPDHSAAIASAVAAALASARQRRSEIMALDEAKGRESLASYFADETDDAVEKVKAALARAPKGAAPSVQGDGPAATSLTTTGVTAFQQRVMNAEGLNGGGEGPRPNGDRAILSAAADARNKRR